MTNINYKYKNIKVIMALLLIIAMIIPLFGTNVQAGTIGNEGGGATNSGLGHFWHATGTTTPSHQAPTSAWKYLVSVQDRSEAKFIERVDKLPNARGFQNPDGTYEKLSTSCRRSDNIWWYGRRQGQRDEMKMYTQAGKNDDAGWPHSMNSNQKRIFEKYKTSKDSRWGKNPGVVIICDAAFERDEEQKPVIRLQADSSRREYNGKKQWLQGWSTKDEGRLKPGHEIHAHAGVEGLEVGKYNSTFYSYANIRRIDNKEIVNHEYNLQLLNGTLEIYKPKAPKKIDITLHAKSDRRIFTGDYQWLEGWTTNDKNKLKKGHEIDAYAGRGETEVGKYSNYFHHANVVRSNDKSIVSEEYNIKTVNGELDIFPRPPIPPKEDPKPIPTPKPVNRTLKVHHINEDNGNYLKRDQFTLKEGSSYNQKAKQFTNRAGVAYEPVGDIHQTGTITGNKTLEFYYKLPKKKPGQNTTPDPVTKYDIVIEHRDNVTDELLQKNTLRVPNETYYNERSKSFKTTDGKPYVATGNTHQTGIIRGSGVTLRFYYNPPVKQKYNIKIEHIDNKTHEMIRQRNKKVEDGTSYTERSLNLRDKAGNSYKKVGRTTQSGIIRGSDITLRFYYELIKPVPKPDITESGPAKGKTSQCVFPESFKTQVNTKNLVAGADQYNPTNKRMDSLTDSHVTKAGEYLVNPKPEIGAKEADVKKWHSNLEKIKPDTFAGELNLDGRNTNSVTDMLSTHGGVYNVTKTRNYETHTSVTCQPQKRTKLSRVDKTYDNDGNLVREHTVHYLSKWKNNGGRELDKRQIKRDRVQSSYQLFAVNCNKEGFNKYKGHGEVISIAEGDGSGILKTRTIDGVIGPLGKRGETANSRFYTDGKSCEEAFKCTSSKPTSESVKNNSIENRGNEPLFTEVKEDGIHGESKDGNLVFFRDNNDRQVRADLWYPIATGKADLITFPDNKADKTYAKVYGGSPEIDITTIAPWKGKDKSDRNKITSMNKEQVWNEEVNKLNIKSQWAGDRGKPYEVALNWSYNARADNKIPTVVTGDRIVSDKVLQHEFQVVCPFYNNTKNKVDASVPDTPHTSAKRSKTQWNEKDSIKAEFTRAVSDNKDK